MRARAALAAAATLALIAGGVAGGQGATSPSDAPSSADAVPASARLTVVPDGPQRLDLATLVTDLPEGGRIVDAATGLALDAERIRFREGEFVEADGVTAAFADVRFDALGLDSLARLTLAVDLDERGYAISELEVNEAGSIDGLTDHLLRRS